MWGYIYIYIYIYIYLRVIYTYIYQSYNLYWCHIEWETFSKACLTGVGWETNVKGFSRKIPWAKIKIFHTHCLCIALSTSSVKKSWLFHKWYSNVIHDKTSKHNWNQTFRIMPHAKEIETYGKTHIFNLIFASYSAKFMCNVKND